MSAALALQATRPQYIPTSLLPGVVGLVAAAGAGADWWLAPLVLVALFAAHAGTNVINDVEDFASGVDSPDKMDNSRVFNTGLMSLDDGRLLARGLFALAFAIGAFIAALQAPELLIVGCAGLAIGWFYSAGPRPLKHAGLGDVAIVFAMGPLITQGAYTAVTGDAFHAGAFWIGFAPGFLIAAVLAGNNLSDLEGDRAAGVRTLAVRLGFARARVLYLGLLACAYATIAAVGAADLFGWAPLVALVTLPLAVGLFRRTSGGPDALIPLALETVKVHMAVTVILVVAVLAERA